MRIVFGWNHFIIKSYTAKDLGINDPDLPDFRVELRQKYFHLFWIPFFGIGKMWGLRRNGSLYEVPASIQALLVNLPKKRSPWYTFTLPLLGVLALVIVVINGFVQDMKYQQYREDSFSRNKKELSEKIKKLNSKDVLSFEGEHPFLLKVEQVKNGEVLFTKLSSEALVNLENWYCDHWQELDTITASQKELLAALDIPYPEGEGSNPDVFKMNIPGIGTCNLSGIDRYFGPRIVDRGTGGWGNGSLWIELTNEGWPARITEIKNLGSNIHWTTALPLPIASNAYSGFQLEADNYQVGTPYKVQLTVEDSTGALTKYIVEGANMDKTVSVVD